MGEIRQDPTTKEWVIMAKDRAERTRDSVPERVRKDLPMYSPTCPFCPGNEEMTPPDVLSYSDEKTGRWGVRVVANRFPAVTPEGTTKRRLEDSFFLSMDSVGIHEVIVECPEHNKTPDAMDPDALTQVLMAYQERYKALSRLPFVKSIIIFKNHGPRAGTSLDHPHSQLVAVPVVPTETRARYEVAIRHYDDNGSCLYMDLVRQEQDSGTRIVMESNGFVVFHPFASKYPFETWIMPKKHEASFGNASQGDLAGLADALHNTMTKLRRAVDNADFNLVLDSAPVGDEGKEYYLWHIRIIPRLTEIAGFEIGTGIHINTSLPEETARAMRDA